MANAEEWLNEDDDDDKEYDEFQVSEEMQEQLNDVYDMVDDYSDYFTPEQIMGRKVQGVTIAAGTIVGGVGGFYLMPDANALTVLGGGVVGALLGAIGARATGPLAEMLSFKLRVFKNKMKFKKDVKSEIKDLAQPKATERTAPTYQDLVEDYSEAMAFRLLEDYHRNNEISDEKKFDAQESADEYFRGVAQGKCGECVSKDISTGKKFTQCEVKGCVLMDELKTVGLFGGEDGFESFKEMGI